MSDIAKKGASVVRISVSVSAPVARALRGLEQPSPESRGLEKAIRSLRAKLVPVHDHTADELLITHYFVEADGDADAQLVIDKLLPQPAVIAAYVKPKDTAP